MTALDSGKLPDGDLVRDVAMLPFLTDHPGGIAMVDERKTTLEHGPTKLCPANTGAARVQGRVVRGDPP
ncbi:hypothetical protein GCM10010176_082300 [Nonomuraea spiralis]|nr:hypothetical protein GCM10010176_082300 [Nonomuraea spiralis]